MTTENDADREAFDAWWDSQPTDITIIGRERGYSIWSAAHASQLTEIKKLRSSVSALESLRPHWAKGFSSDSSAAQAATAALAQVWGALEVENQTHAMAKLRDLLAHARQPGEPVAWVNKSFRDSILEHSGKVYWHGPMMCGKEFKGSFPVYLSAPPAPVAVPDELEEAIRLTEVGEFLFNACRYSGGDGYTEPLEFGIEWQWQQSAPNQYGEGMLLAASTRWHDVQAEVGTITEARKLRAMLSATPSHPEGREGA